MSTGKNNVLASCEPFLSLLSVNLKRTKKRCWPVAIKCLLSLSWPYSAKQRLKKIDAIDRGQGKEFF